MKLTVRLALKALAAGLSRTLGDPILRARVLRGLAINALLFVAVLAGLAWGLFALVDAWVTTGWLAVALKIATVIAALLTAPVVFALVHSLLAPLLNDAVFEHARRTAGAAPRGDGALGTPTSVAIELRRLARFLGVTVALLLLNLIPVAGTAAYVVGQAALSAWTLGWDLLAWHFEVKGLKYADQRAWVRANRPGVLALGAGALVLTVIPVLNLVCVTTNIAAAGFLSAWLDEA